MDLEVSVKERELLGQIQGGPGYSTSTGITLNGEFSRENIFGLGVTTALQMNIITTIGATRQFVGENQQSARAYEPATFLNFQYIELV